MPIYMPNINIRYWCISEILMVKEYWNLIGQQPFLAIAWESDFSQACSFRRILMNHKNFHFTQIPDKTMWFSLTVQKPCFGAIFDHFAWSGFFPKNPALSHTTIYGSLTPWVPNTKFQKKTIELIPITYGQTDRWTEGQKDGWMDRPYLTGTFRLRPRVQ